MITTAQESNVLDHLRNAWEAFLILDTEHPDEQNEFRYAIHLAQQIIATRLARRADPNMWPTHAEP